MIVNDDWKRRARAGLAIALGACGFAAFPAAHATLGQLEASVPADQNQLRASMKTVPGQRFTVHELQIPSGSTVREYVSPAGMVFGIAWEGPSMPDLRQVLGANFDPYAAALAERRTRRAPVLVQLPGLVVQSSGHMRSFSGRAYIPQALPPGVAPEDVQ